jgi:hypothetical protein
MGLFPILAIGVCLVGFACLGAYMIKKAGNRISPMVFVARGVLIVAMIGIIAFGWYMRGSV